MTDFFSTSSVSIWATLCFAVALVFNLWLKFWLASRHIRHVSHHRNAVPDVFAGKISLESHQKAADYTIAKSGLGLYELAWSAAILLGWTLLGGLSWINGILMDWLGTGLRQEITLLIAFALINSILDLPFTLYQTFVVEQRFGFNKTSVGLWLKDLVISTLLSLAIGVPFIALVLWMMGASGTWWWLWVWCAWMGFVLLAQWIYPTLIAPLFNKFQPLQDAQVVDRVSALMQRCGFTAKGFYVMDGSKRSAHSNAYFTGFGHSKRVVFYDTLLAQLSPDEVDAVLAHELGHFTHRHILKRMALMFTISLGGLFVLGWISQQAWFFYGLGVAPNLTTDNHALALILFMLIAPLVSTFLGPLFAHLSRKDEFEADAYAVAKTSGAALASALLKLFKDNASTLTPDPVYVRFYYSHPAASERLGRILLAPSST
jgi:STE24 endopeptidase